MFGTPNSNSKSKENALRNSRGSLLLGSPLRYNNVGFNTPRVSPSWNTSPKVASGGRKSVQTAAGPLLATRLQYNSGLMWGDVHSPGFSGRIARYSRVGNTATHQSPYLSPGHMPVVRLDSSSRKLPVLSPRNAAKVVKSPNSLRIASPYSPDIRSYSTLNKSEISTGRSFSPEESRKSILQTLKEFSKKRSYSEIATDIIDDDLENDQTNRPNRDETNQTLTNGSVRNAKRPLDSEDNDNPQPKKKFYNNEILSSLSSTRNIPLERLTGKKRKTDCLNWSRSSTPVLQKQQKTVTSAERDDRENRWSPDDRESIPEKGTEKPHSETNGFRVSSGVPSSDGEIQQESVSTEHTTDTVRTQKRVSKLTSNFDTPKRHYISKTTKLSNLDKAMLNVMCPTTQPNTPVSGSAVVDTSTATDSAFNTNDKPLIAATKTPGKSNDTDSESGRISASTGKFPIGNTESNKTQHMPNTAVSTISGESPQTSSPDQSNVFGSRSSSCAFGYSFVMTPSGSSSPICSPSSAGGNTIPTSSPKPFTFQQKTQAVAETNLSTSTVSAITSSKPHEVGKFTFGNAVAPSNNSQLAFGTTKPSEQSLATSEDSITTFLKSFISPSQKLEGNSGKSETSGKSTTTSSVDSTVSQTSTATNNVSKGIFTFGGKTSVQSPERGTNSTETSQSQILSTRSTSNSDVQQLPSATAGTFSFGGNLSKQASSSNQDNSTELSPGRNIFGSKPPGSVQPPSSNSVQSSYVSSSVSTTTTSSDSTAKSLFSFGNSSNSPASGGFSFSGSKPETSASVFTFGNSNCQTTTTASTGFTFDKAPLPVSSPSSTPGFSFAKTTTSQNFSFGTASNQLSSSPTVTFGKLPSQTVTTASSVTFGQVSAAATPFSFGGVKVQPSSTTSSLTFGASSSQSSTTTSSLAFGAVSNQPSTTVSSLAFGAGSNQPSTTVSSLAFGAGSNQPSTTVSSLAFGAGSNQPSTTVSSLAFGVSSNQPITTTSSLAFGVGLNQTSTTSALAFGVSSNQPPTTASSFIFKGSSIQPSTTAAVFSFGKSSTQPTTTTSAFSPPSNTPFGSIPSGNSVLSFGNKVTATASTVGGFPFGNNVSQPAVSIASAGTFAFGKTSGDSATNSTGFGAVSNNQPPPVFAFGATPTTSTATTSAQPFNFAPQAPATTASSGPFMFASQTSPPNPFSSQTNTSSFGFPSQPATTATTTPFQFGSQTATSATPFPFTPQTATSTATPFPFGSSQPSSTPFQFGSQTATTSASGFNAPATNASVFAFGNSAPQPAVTSAAGFSFPSSSQIQNPSTSIFAFGNNSSQQSGFSFNNNNISAPTQPPFGVTPAPAQQSQFGQSTQQNQFGAGGFGNTQQSSGFGFGNATAASVPAPFGQQQSPLFQFGQNAAPPQQSSGGFNFGSPTNQPFNPTPSVGPNMFPAGVMPAGAMPGFSGNTMFSIGSGSTAPRARASRTRRPR